MLRANHRIHIIDDIHTSAVQCNELPLKELVFDHSPGDIQMDLTWL